MDSTASRMGRTNTIRTRIRTAVQPESVRSEPIPVRAAVHVCAGRSGGHHSGSGDISYERAEHASVTRAYGEMTIGLLVTAAVAILTQATGAYIALIQSLGVIGAWAPFVEIVIAIYLGARIE